MRRQDFTKIVDIQKFILDNSSNWLNDETLLKPVLEDDPLLYAIEDLDDIEPGHIYSNKHDGDLDLNQQIAELSQKLYESELKNQSLSNAFNAYKETVMETYLNSNVKNLILNPATEEKVNVTQFNDEGNYYFESYAATEIHESMLKDAVRTEGYRDFVYNNKHYFKGKTVLDVGCGTGILSMFAAKAGAARVFSVDNSNIISKAKEIVKDNNLDHIITFFKGKVEEIELPVEKVDIIISEWMGYFLLFEGMLDSVLYARDKWLAPDGIMAPSQTDVLISAFGDGDWYDDKVNFWNDVYGFSMNSMNSDTKKNGLVTVVSGKEMISDSVVVQEIDTANVSIPKLDFTSPFTLNISKTGKVYAFCGWFDTHFRGIDMDPVSFSTSPFTTPTHWMQTMFILESPLPVNESDIVEGVFTCTKSLNNPRELDVTIRFKVEGSDQEFTQHFGVV